MNKTFENLHDKAMKFSDEGIIAKAKGELDVANYCFEMAYPFEKQAALGYLVKDENTQLIKSILLRSAITLAVRADYLWEARNLAKRALKENIHPAIEHEIKELLIEIEKKIHQIKKDTVQITGTITNIDTIISEITIWVTKDNLNRKVLMSRRKLSEIVRLFWEKTVTISGQPDNKGMIFLDDIQHAA